MSLATFSRLIETMLGPIFSQQITWLMLHFLWQGLLVGAGAYVSSLCMIRSPSTTKYRVYVIWMVLLSLAPPATWWFGKDSSNPPIPFSATRESSIPDGGLPKQGMETTVGQAYESNRQYSARTALPSSAAGLDPWSGIVALGYLCGVVFMLSRLGLSGLHLRGQSSRAASICDEDFLLRIVHLCERVHLRRPPRVRQGEHVVVPIVFGVFKPVILLPPFAISGMTSEELDAILLHELAHVRRGDLAVNCLQRLAEAVLFFHPVTWYLSHKISTAREECCDDIVLARCERRDYASALVRLAEWVVDSNQPHTALAVTGPPSELRRRVMRILGSDTPTSVDRAGPIMTLACILLIGCFAFTVRAQTEDGSQIAPSSPPKDGSEVTVEAASSALKPHQGQAAPTQSRYVVEERGKDRYAKFDLSPKTPELRRIEVAMWDTVSFRFQNTLLKDVIRLVERHHGFTMSIDMEALQHAKINPDAIQISSESSQIRLSSALLLILQQHRLTYRMDSGRVLVTTPMAAKRSTSESLKAFNGLAFEQPSSTWQAEVQKRIDHGRNLFELNCKQCHGRDGDGRGPTAAFLNPKPRDFTKRQFGNVRLDDEHQLTDLRKVILQGSEGTAMPAFQLLSKYQVDALAEYVMYLTNGKQLPPPPKNNLRFSPEIEKGMLHPLERKPTTNLRFDPDIERGMQLERIEPKSRR